MPLYWRVLVQLSSTGCSREATPVLVGAEADCGDADADHTPQLKRPVVPLLEHLHSVMMSVTSFVPPNSSKPRHN